MKVYILFSDHVGGKPTNLSANYRSGMWIVKVKAGSIKQAYALYYTQPMAIDNSSIGIIGIECSWPREWNWKNVPLNRPSWLKLAEFNN